MQGNSRGYLYHDDFQSLAYQQGDYVLCEITMQSAITLTSRQVLCVIFGGGRVVKMPFLLGATSMDAKCLDCGYRVAYSCIWLAILNVSHNLVACHCRIIAFLYFFVCKNKLTESDENIRMQ